MTMGERPLLIAAERLFEALGFPPGEAHLRRCHRPSKGWVLQRRWVENDRPKCEDITSKHPDKDSLWRAITDQRMIFEKIARGIADDLSVTINCQDHD